jgi:hypothetical protein
VEVRVTAVAQPTGHGGETQFIAKAITPLGTPVLDQERLIIVPDVERRRCEWAIARVADMFSIATRCRRQIVSATPTVALIPEDEGDNAQLAEAVALRIDAPRALTTFQADVNVADIAEAMSDRWDGVALLAEAYSHHVMSGRYRDLVRLFELAFGKSFMQVGKKLRQTLLPAMGYTAAEIKKWQALRHPFSHADGITTREIALEPDAWPVFQRMEQAALDILFNKAIWREWSSARRDAWRPYSITVNEMGQGIVAQGSKPRIEFLLLDEFGVFPRVAQLQHTGLPTDWFYKIPT